MESGQDHHQDADLLLHKYRSEHPLKTVAFLVGTQRVNVIWTFFYFFIKHMPVWVAPYMAARMVDVVVGQPPVENPLREVVILALILGGLYFQNIFTAGLHGWYLSKARRALELALRSALVRRLQHLSMGFYESFHSGKIFNKVLRDVEGIETLFGQFFNALLPAVMNLVVILLIVLWQKPGMGLFFILTIPLMALWIVFTRRKIQNRTKHFRTELEQMSADVSEMIEMIPVSRAHSLEQREITRIDKQLTRVRDSGIRFDLITTIFGAGSWATLQIFSVACLFFSVYLALHKKITIGDVLMYHAYYNQIINGLGMVLHIFPMYMKGLDSIKSIGEVLECPDIELNEGKTPVTEVQGRFTLEKVGYHYEGRPSWAVRDFSLNIPAGATVALVGCSGAGKTTLINLLIGFRRPSGGRILMDDQDMQELDLRQYRRHIAVVSQSTILFHGTVRDNIVHGQEEISDDAVQKALEMAQAWEFVRQFPDGLHTVIGEKGTRLSGGQRQRLAIARALIRDPRVIFLDEPTSSLDVVSERLVQEAIAELIRGRTTFIVAHRLSTIRQASQIAVMGEGRLLEVGRYEDLLSAKGEFYRLHESQFWSVTSDAGDKIHPAGIHTIEAGKFL